MNTRTILLPIYNGIRAKNFFRTDIYTELVRDVSLRLVVAVPRSKLEYYRREFPDRNVIFEPLEIISEPEFGRILSVIAFNLLDTDTIRAKQWWEYMRYGKYWKFVLKRGVNLVFGRMRFIRHLIRLLDRLVAIDPAAASLLEKYKPDLIIIPDIVFPPDRVFLRAAKRLGYFVIGMIRSWDNLTSKGVIQILPDKLMVHTTIMKQEAVRYAGMPERDIAVTGIPAYDMFFKKSAVSHDDFLRSLGIPPERRVILCAPFLYSFTGSAAVIVNGLIQAIERGTLPADLHLIVRYRPATPDFPEGAVKASDHMTITRPCEYFFPVKNIQSPTEDWEFSKKDLDLLQHSLYYSDVTINVMSTLSIDAAIYDKPVINVRFEADPACPPWQRHDIFTPFVHYRELEETGGIRMAWSMEELIHRINEYLKNPALDREGRSRIVKEQVEFTDGQSGQRAAGYIKDLLNRQ